MLRFGCPKCGHNIRLVDLRQRLSPQGRRGKRLCPGCGAWLECTNGYQLGALHGLILGLLLASSRFWPGSEWARLAVVLTLAVVLGVTIAPLLVSRFGRWRVLADGFHDSAEVRKWSRVANVSALVGVAALLLASLSVSLQARALPERIQGVQTGEALSELVHHFMAGMLLSFTAGLAIGVAALWISYRAWRRRGEARSAEHSASLT